MTKCQPGFQAIPHIHPHPHHWRWCTFLKLVPFFAQRMQNVGQFWLFCRKLTHFLVPFLHARLARWCPKIDKYQVCLKLGAGRWGASAHPILADARKGPTSQWGPAPSTARISTFWRYNHHIFKNYTRPIPNLEKRVQDYKRRRNLQAFLFLRHKI